MDWRGFGYMGLAIVCLASLAIGLQCIWWLLQLPSFVHHALSLVRYGTINIPHDVAIEVNNYCNRACWYCPQSLVKFPREEMADETFNLILNRLVEFKFVGQINYSIFNEPLEDKRLRDFVEKTRKVLPKCRIIVNTNGDRLNHSFVEELLYAGVSRFVVTEHPPSNENWNKRISDLAKWRPLKIRVQKLDRLKNVAGLIDGVASGPFTNPCSSPRDVLVIRFNGDIGICCNDYYRKSLMGNILTSSIKSIWFSPDFKKLRAELVKGHRTFSLCINCNGGYV
jgi:cyclic pyranopterin phosphate synthase